MYFLGALAAAMSLGACSSDDDPAMPDEQQVGPNSQYLAINIMPTDGGSRAVGNDGFENGSSAENDIKNAIFFFYDNNGNAVNVKYEDTTTKPSDMASNYVYVGALTGNGSATPNVESIKEAVLVLNCKPGDLPTRVVCFANVDGTTVAGQPFDFKTCAGKSMTDMQALVANLDVAQIASRDDDAKPEPKGFFMSSSVYREGNGTNVCYSTLSTANYGKDAATATANPVKVYVERALAKVTFATATTITGNKMVIGQLNGQDVYFHIEGWGTGDRAQQSYCLKNITGIQNPFTDWNELARYRSYWAVNPTLPGTAGWGNSNYNAFTLSNPCYIQENACGVQNPASPARATKVMIAGKLQKADGTDLRLYEIAGQKYVYSSFDDIKTAFLQQLKYAGKTPWKVNGNNVAEIDKDDITLAATSNTDAKTYLTVVKLNEGTYYATYQEAFTVANDGTATALNVDTFNTWLATNMPIKVWNEGRGYYYAELKHFAPLNPIQEGYEGYGVVRNHVYKFELTGITGFPTPVYDPSKEIIPEKPVDENVYVAAQINVLSWRIVNQSQSIDWN